MKLNANILAKKLLSNNNGIIFASSRFISNKEAIERRNHLFTLEKKRQLEQVGRIEKIEVKYKGIPNDCTLIMNRNISTPYDCAKHFSEWHMDSSALALIDGQDHWDMHKPLQQSCTLELLNFNCQQPNQVNKAFWRTCSLLLGACVTRAFKENITVKLHSFPGPDIRSGSFMYNVDMPDLPDWSPSDVEVRSLSAEYVKFIREGHNIERLEVTEELALAMFEDNQHKSEQIPSITGQHGNVTLYRIGDHVDISKGPLISHTNQIGRVTVAAVHKLEKKDSGLQLYRFQGVALPKGVHLDHFAYSILEDRARKFNPGSNYEKTSKYNNRQKKMKVNVN